MENQDEAWLLKEKYHGKKSAEFFSDCERLRTGEPLAYIIGYIPFLGCTICLDSRPLIPRPETEWWTERAIAAIQASIPPNPMVSDRTFVLDLCAGSGCIGVAVAKTIGFDVEVHFTEIDSRHHETIRKNMALASIDDLRIPVFGGSGFERLASTPYATFRYNFILTNPPYIDPALDRTEASVKNFEPHLALYGGIGGMIIIEQIITQAPAHLTPNGQLWIEHEPEQTTAIASLAAVNGFSISTHPDQYGRLRYSVLVLQ